MRAFVLLAPLALLASGARAEQPLYFQACDGYGAPTDNGDGMTKEARTRGLFGLVAPRGVNGNTRRQTPPLGSVGVQACDRALADVRLTDQQWLRRASLLRARAVHDLAAGDVPQAGVDLDRAQAALRDTSDPYVQRSMGLGLRLVRAYLRRAQGDMAGATELLAGVWRDRPLDRHVDLATLTILGDAHTNLGGASVARVLASLDPRMLDVIYVDLFDQRDFTGVVALFPQLVPPARTLDKGVSRADVTVEAARNDQRAVVTGADRRARLAFALAALDRPAAAREALTDAERFVADATPAATPPLAPGEKESAKARLARALNGGQIQAASLAREVLDAWRPLVEARLAVASEPPVAVAARIASSRIRSPGAILEILEAARRRGAPGLDDSIRAVEAGLARHPPLQARDARVVFEALPHTEIAERVATYRKANTGFFEILWGGISGFRTTPGTTPDTMTISFTGEKSSAAVVEELALLRAADMARTAGRDGFVILERRDYERTENTTYYGRTIRSDPTGYTTELEVEFVNRAALPARYRDAAWRVLSAEEVTTRLAPTYLAPATAPPTA